MIYPHVIRLAGPWEYEVLRCDSSDWTGANSGRAQLPLDGSKLLGASFRGLVGFRRRFNRPTNLGPQETVWLVIESVDSQGQVELNGVSLGTVRGGNQAAEFDVTRHLELHNELTLESSSSSKIDGVRLEIRLVSPYQKSVESH